MIKIRSATAADATAALNLIRELALFEKAPEKVTNSLEAFIHDGFGDRPCFELTLAENTDTGEIVGMALYYIGYSTWRGKTVFLDDLVVREAWRGRGIGQQLLDAVFLYAVEVQANIVKWQVLDWNEAALRFYLRQPFEMEMDGEWIDCKILRSDFEKKYRNKNEYK